jgi:protein-tyrosine phosphatase
MNPVLLVQAAELITPDRIASELHRLTPEGRESFLTLTVPGFPAYEEPPAPAPSKIVIPMRTVLPKRPGYKAPAEGSVNVSDLPSPSFSSFQPVRKGNPYYSYIDPSIAIGDHRSSYDGFNVVVNLNYPFNGAERHAVTATVEKEQLVINVGIEDNPTEPMLDLLQKIVPYLLDLRSRNRKMTVLFHCYAGISRSSSLAIAYYAKLAGTSLDHTLTIATTHRPQVRPNPGFMDALAAYLQK